MFAEGDVCGGGLEEDPYSRYRSFSPMARTYLDTGRPIVALATAPGRSALAVIRTSGEKAIELCARCFSPSAVLASAKGYTMVHGYLTDPESGERVDEVVAAVFRGPKSFTGEDAVEFSCHGSAAVASRALAALEGAGSLFPPFLENSASAPSSMARLISSKLKR